MPRTHTQNIGNDKAHLSNLFRYAKNEAKTHGKELIIADGTTLENGYEDMLNLVSRRELLTGKKVKTNFFRVEICHEMRNEDLTLAAKKALVKKDLDLYKELVGPGYKVIAFGHEMSERETDPGYFHVHIIVCTVNSKDLSKPLLRNNREDWYKMDELYYDAYPQERKLHRNYKEYEIENRKKTKTNSKEIVSYKQKPNEKIVKEIHGKTSYKTELYEYDNKLYNDYHYKNTVKVKCEIDDVIETVKENFSKGKSKYNNFKAFTIELNDRGWNTSVKNGKFGCKPKDWKYPVYIKDSGYTKVDIEKRLSGEMQFTPNHPEIFEYNDTSKLKTTQKKKEQLEYRNYCQRRKVLRTAKLINYLFGDNLFSLIIAILYLLIQMHTLKLFQETAVKERPTIVKEIKQQIETAKLKKEISSATANAEEDKIQTPKKKQSEFDDKSHIEQIQTDSISNNAVNSTNNNTAEASQSVLELKINTTTHLDSSESIKKTTENAVSEPETAERGSFDWYIEQLEENRRLAKANKDLKGKKDKNGNTLYSAKEQKIINSNGDAILSEIAKGWPEYVDYINNSQSMGQSMVWGKQVAVDQYSEFKRQQLNAVTNKYTLSRALSGEAKTSKPTDYFSKKHNFDEEL